MTVIVARISCIADWLYGCMIYSHTDTHVWRVRLARTAWPSGY
jgi:hypothetical protein